MSTPNTPNTPAPQAPATKTGAVSDKELLDLLNTVKTLNEDKIKRETKEKEEAEKKAKAEKATQNIDWSKIEEKDVFDFSVPIPAIEQNLPNVMDINLKDRNYVARWVNKSRDRLGPMLQAGFDYIRKEDLDPNFPVSLSFDTEGHLSYMDTVALKVPKSKYYPALRKNHEKNAQIHGANRVKAKINNQVANSPAVENAFRRGAFSVYEDETKTEQISDESLENVTL